MTFDEVYETLPGNGWLSKPEAALLWQWVSSTKGTILEVGCYQGRSTVLLAQTGRQVIAVDPFEEFDSDDPDGLKTFNKFLANVHRFDNVHLHPIKIEDWIPIACGFAYLDGNHTYKGTLNQIAKATETGAKTIAIHDVNDSGGGLEIKRAAYSVLGGYTERVERLAVWDLL